MSPRAATTTRVDATELTDFVRLRHQFVLITTRQDGSPQASPVTGGVDAEGRLVISSYPERAKSRNAARDARVSVLVLSQEFDDEWVQIDGTAQVLAGEEAVEPLVEYFRVISGEHSDWADYRDAMRRQGKCLIRVTPTRWGPIATGGFPPRLTD
ncbi:MAG: PPOX class F420-dependent oxidoreductase [Allobranchiibius sp.]